MAEKGARWNPDVRVASRQTVPQHLTGWLLLLTLLVLLLTVTVSVAAQQSEDLDTTIQHLITYVRESDVTFERNISRHDSVEAAAHIEKKYQHFRDEIDTPEQFIERCATASLVTGKQYLIIDSQGDETPAGEWLDTELARYRLQNAQQ
ncbi:MAG: DUF5329 family protein [Gammaproteobacteria bacterium]